MVQDLRSMMKAKASYRLNTVTRVDLPMTSFTIHLKPWDACKISPFLNILALLLSPEEVSNHRALDPIIGTK
jgi:hypothetical protein